MSDFQALKKMLEALMWVMVCYPCHKFAALTFGGLFETSPHRIKEQVRSSTDSHPSLAPKQIYEYLSNVMYAKRTKMNPLWNAILLGGHKDGERWVSS
jgi:hypothetical protein